MNVTKEKKYGLPHDTYLEYWPYFEHANVKYIDACVCKI